MVSLGVASNDSKNIDNSDTKNDKAMSVVRLHLGNAKSFAHLMKSRSRNASKVSEVSSSSLKDLRTRLSVFFLSTSAAATANAFVQPVQPQACQDWSSLSSVYDEAKVHGGHIYYSYYVSGANSVASTGGIVYDPIDNTALGGTSNAVTYSQMSLFNVVSGQSGVQPIAVTHKHPGLIPFKWHTLPGKPARSVTVGSTVFGNEWGSTKDSADVWGYLKLFIPAQGAMTTSTFYAQMVLDVSFRSRV